MSTTASKVDWANLSKHDVARIVSDASRLVDAFARRSPTSEHATLSESDAIFNLRWTFKQIEEAS